MIPVSAIVTTRNEELNLERTLRSLVGFVDEIFVIDSDSTDGTIAIAKQLSVTLVNMPYEHGRIIPWIYQWGLENLPIRNEWVLILEADQRPDDSLKRALEDVFSGGAISAAGFYFRRRQIFRGSMLRFGGYGTKWMLKLFRKDRGELDPKEEDTRVYVNGPTVKLAGTLLEENAKEWQILFYLEKHLRYADAFAKDELMRRHSGIRWKVQPRFFGTPDQRVLWLKSWYYRTPLYVRPWVYFVFRYIVLLGFLDGRQGFVFHFLQAFWFRLVVDIRLEEIMERDRLSIAREQSTHNG